MSLAAPRRCSLGLPCLLLGGCIPDLGAALESDTSADSRAVPLDASNHNASNHDRDAGQEDAGSDPDAGPTGPLCDDSAPSEEVDSYVWGENFTFYFTPAGDEITTLYVPRNALVHFSLAGSTNEEVHIYGIRLAECETLPGGVGLGTEGIESTYDWKAPKTAGTYPFAGYCVNHDGMEFDIVVTQ